MTVHTVIKQCKFRQAITDSIDDVHLSGSDIWKSKKVKNPSIIHHDSNGNPGMGYAVDRGITRGCTCFVACGPTQPYTPLACKQVHSSEHKHHRGKLTTKVSSRLGNLEKRFEATSLGKLEKKMEWKIDKRLSPADYTHQLKRTDHNSRSTSN